MKSLILAFATIFFGVSARASEVNIDYDEIDYPSRMRFIAEAVAFVGQASEYFLNADYEQPQGVDEFAFQRDINNLSLYLTAEPIYFYPGDMVKVHTRFLIKLSDYDFSKNAWLVFAPNSLRAFNGAILSAQGRKYMQINLVYDTDDTMNFYLDSEYKELFDGDINRDLKYGNFDLSYVRMDSTQAEQLRKASKNGIVVFDGNCLLEQGNGDRPSDYTQCRYIDGYFEAADAKVEFIPY